MIFSRKALDQFDDDEIVSTVERRGMVILQEGRI